MQIFNFNLINTKAKKEFFRFILSGICSFSTDMICYYLLSVFINISLAKGISFILGTITSYLMNKHYTFKQNKKSITEVIKFISLYLFSMCTNIAVNKLILNILPSDIAKITAFLSATAVSTIINFLGLKFWVFKSKGENK